MSRNSGLLAVQPLDIAGSPTEFHYKCTYLVTPMYEIASRLVAFIGIRPWTCIRVDRQDGWAITR
jgi:hypothetical protein